MSLAVVLFLVATGSILYVLLLYPVLLAVWARLFGQPIKKAFVRDKAVTFLIPVRNGAQWIVRKLESLEALDYPLELVQVFVLSDGSMDETNALVRKYSGKLRVRLFELTGGGKAAALNRGLSEAQTELVVLTDVRQEFDRAALSELVACFADPAVGVVTGELVIRAGANAEEVNTGLYWKYEKWIRRNLNRIDAMLGATGAIYAMRRELIRPIPSETLLDDVYLPLAAALEGHRVYFECDAKAYDFPTGLKSEFRRKVRTQAGVYQLMGQLPGLLSPFKRRFVHFFSHKVGRLLLPFAFIAVAVSSFFLSEPWRTAILSAQAAFYGAAAVDRFVPERSPLKRITGVCRTFIVLVTAALCAIAIFFVPAQWLWKDTRISASTDMNGASEKGTVRHVSNASMREQR